MKRRTKRVLFGVVAGLAVMLLLGGGVLFYLVHHPDYGGQVLCMQNLYALTTEMQRYMEEHEGHAPETIEAFRTYCGQSFAGCFVCPSDPEGTLSYEMAPGCNDLTNPNRILIREREPRHHGRRCAMYADLTIRLAE